VSAPENPRFATSRSASSTAESLSPLSNAFWIRDWTDERLECSGGIEARAARPAPTPAERFNMLGSAARATAPAIVDARSLAAARVGCGAAAAGALLVLAGAEAAPALARAGADALLGRAAGARPSSASEPKPLACGAVALEVETSPNISSKARSTS